MTRAKRWTLLVLLGAGLFLYGVCVGKYRWPPHDALHSLFREIPGERKAEREALEAAGRAKEERRRNRLQAVDPSTLITLRTLEEVEARRRELALRVFGPGGLPLDRRPSLVETSVEHPDFPIGAPVERIDRVTVEMEPGIRSVVYLFHAAPGRPFVLYHQGHDGHLRYGKEAVLRLLREGFSVMAFQMPLLGENRGPRIPHPRLGVVDLESHDQLAVLERPLRFFLEPVCVGINHLVESHGAKSVDMVGISGGGWTTTVYAALDPRVRVSVPVAGTLPLYLRDDHGWGDYEQHAPELVETAGYLDLYVMGAAGEGRRQLQVMHRLDSIAFSGDACRIYEKAVANAVDALGAGKWELHLDEEGTVHAVTPTDFEVILPRLSR